MMPKYEDREEFRDHMDYEGGAWDFFAGYGVSPEDAPDDEIKELIVNINEKIKPVQQAFEELYDKLDY